MRPLLHPNLVNGRSGDPALYVETLFETHALLFDLGDIAALAPRKVQRIEHIFVSHAHIDHFVGFDRLLRLLVGREKTVRLHGPPGFAARVHHKLQGYHWNLASLFRNDLVLIVSGLDGSLALRTTRFRLRNAFCAEPMGTSEAGNGILHRPRDTMSPPRSWIIACRASVLRCRKPRTSTSGRRDWPNGDLPSARG